MCEIKKKYFRKGTFLQSLINQHFFEYFHTKQKCNIFFNIFKENKNFPSGNLKNKSSKWEIKKKNSNVVHLEKN